MPIVDDKHIFAIFIKKGLLTSNLQKLLVTRQSYPELFFRLKNVLRAQIGQKYFFFNDDYYAEACIDAINNDEVSGDILGIYATPTPRYQVHLFLAMPKKAAFEEALYLAVVAGVSAITPLQTEKSSSCAWFNINNPRLAKIMVSAREQAKTFTKVSINAPQTLSTALKSSTSPFLLFSPEGCSFFTLQQRLASQFTQEMQVNILVGPEADFTLLEKEQILQHPSAELVALTKSILRVPEATFLACALFNLK